MGLGRRDFLLDHIISFNDLVFTGKQLAWGEVVTLKFRTSFRFKTIEHTQYKRIFPIGHLPTDVMVDRE